MRSCADVLTICQGMSRLHSLGKPGSADALRRAPRTGAQCTKWRRHVAVPTATNPSAESGVADAGGNSYYPPPLRAAIVGTGGISRIHGWRLQDLGSTVVGVCGRDVMKARAVANEFRPAGQTDDQAGHISTSSPVGAFDDLATMLDQTKPDVLHVCSPHGFHAAHAVEAVKRGINVIIEKPMATEEAEAQALVTAAKGRRRPRCRLSNQAVVPDGRRVTVTNSGRRTRPDQCHSRRVHVLGFQSRKLGLGIRP